MSTPYGTDTNLIMNVFIPIYLAVLGIALMLYAFKAVALFQIGKRRGLRNYALSWFSVGSAWVLGDIADQYCAVIQRKKTNLRYWLLWLTLGSFCAYILGVLAMMVSSFSFLFKHPELNGSMSAAGTMGFDPNMLWMLLPLFIGLGLCSLGMLAVRVICYVACYRVYRSCAPDSAVLFLILSILFPFLEQIFLFSIRKRDDGMLPPAPPQYAVPPQYIPPRPTVQSPASIGADQPTVSMPAPPKTEQGFDNTKE